MLLGERNAVIVFSGRVLSTLFSVLYVLLVPRILGPENYGYYAFWFAQLFLLFSFLDLGSSDLLRRFLPELFYLSTGQAKSLSKKVLQLKLWIVPLLLCLLPLYENKQVFFIIVIASLFAASASIFSDVHFAVNNMVRYSLYHILRKIIRLCLVLALFAIFAKQGIILGLVFAEMTIFFLFSYLTRQELAGEHSPLQRSFLSYLQFGFLVYCATFVYLSVGRLPVIFAKLEGFSFAEIGYFALVIDICYFTLRELFCGISESLQPIQVVDYLSNNHKKLLRSFELTILYTLAIMLPCLCFLAVFNELILGFIGAQYLPSGQYFVWVLPVVGFSVLAWIYRQMLLIAKKTWEILIVNSAMLITFSISVFLPDVITLLSITHALLIASFVNLVLMCFFAIKTFSIENILRQEMILIYTKLLFIVFAFYIFLSAIFQLNFWGTILLLIVSPFLYFGALFYFSVFGKNELELAHRIIGRS